MSKCEGYGYRDKIIRFQEDSEFGCLCSYPALGYKEDGTYFFDERVIKALALLGLTVLALNRREDLFDSEDTVLIPKELPKELVKTITDANITF